MKNIQQILDNIGKSKFAKQNFVNGISHQKMKEYHVFKNGILIDVVRGKKKVIDKYKIAEPRLRNNLQTDGLYFSTDGEYNPKKIQPTGGNFSSYRIYENDELIHTCFSRLECAEFLRCSSANIWRSIKENRKIKEKYTVKKL